MEHETQNAKIETESQGKNYITIGKEWPPCPSCGTPCKPKDTRCIACGCDLTAGGGAVSCFSDEELNTKLNSLSLRRKLMLLFAVLCFAAAVISLFGGIWPLSIIAAIAAVVFWVLKWAAGSQLSLLVKVNVVRTALGEVFTECVYNPKGHIAGYQIQDAKLIDDWNECSGSDHVRGLYRGHSIEFSDIHLEHEETYTDSDGDEHTRRETMFRGQWMVCKLGKPLEHMVRVREKKERRGLAKKVLGSHVNAKGSVETENAAFNQQFQILTQDPHTAFYVLTPHFMEYILAADQQATGRTYLCFSGDTVHIAVDNNRDSFEVNARSPEIKNIPLLRQRIQGEIWYVTSILDELFQNKHLF